MENNTKISLAIITVALLVAASYLYFYFDNNEVLVNEDKFVYETQQDKGIVSQNETGETMNKKFEQKSKELTESFAFPEYTVIQELDLENGKTVKLISANDVSNQETQLEKKNNCRFPEIEQLLVGLEYDGYTINVGEIGVPKKRGGMWQIIENPLDVGNENEMREFEWSPLRVSRENEIIVIDYTDIEPTNPPTPEELDENSDYNFDSVKHKVNSCEFGFTKAFLFRLYNSGYLGVDAYDPIWESNSKRGFLNTFMFLRKDGVYKDNCSPGGCG